MTESEFTVANMFRAVTPRYPELKGKTAVVTGSSMGIGLAIAVRLAAEGMRVVVTGLEADRVQAVADELRARDVEVHGVSGDLSAIDQVDHLMDETARIFGGIDVLVNNAANLKRTWLVEMERDLLEQELAVNVRAPLLLAQRAAAIMPDGGSIVNISSVGGLRAHERPFPYDMTKGAIDAMTRSLAIDLAPRNIRANGVAPGSVRTERSAQFVSNPDSPYHDVVKRIPLQRQGTLAEMAGVVAFLASDDAAYITGQIIYVDGGITTQLGVPGQPI